MIVFTGPEALIVSLLAAALVAFLFRAWERWTALGAALYTGGIALWLWWSFPRTSLQVFPVLPLGIDLGGAMRQFDFVLQLRAENLPIVVTALAMASVAFLLAALVYQGDAFVSGVLMILSGYIGLALFQRGPVEPVLLAPLLLALLTALSVFVLQGNRLGQTLGPLRSLLPPILAFPFFLPVAWYIEQVPLNPQDNEPFQIAGWLLTVGLLLLLAPAPLHSGLPSTAESASPVAMVLLTMLYQLTVLWLLYRAISQFSFVVELAPIELWLTIGGMVTAIWGGVAAVGTSHPGRLWGYALLHNWGVILLSLSVPGPQIWSLVLFLFAMRAISAFVAVAGLSQVREAAGRLDLSSHLQGIGSRLPWSSLALLLGGLGLAGFPLSAGFGGHWAALQVIAESDWRMAAVVLLASGGVVFGFVRMARLLFGPLVHESAAQEQKGGIAVSLASIVISVTVALSPQLLDGPITWALAAFSR